MEPTRTADLPTIAERLNRLRTRIYLESASGISASDKEAFLAFCQELEGSEDTLQEHLRIVSTKQDKLLKFFGMHADVNPHLPAIN